MPLIAAAPPAPLIAPLDVRVTAKVRSGTALHGKWDVTTEEGGSWYGNNITMDETWLPGAKRPTRIRGKAAGGPTKVHYVDVVVLNQRTGSGVLTEAQEHPDPAHDLKLLCRAQGAGEPGETMTTSLTVTMQIVDQPARGRVEIRGPGIPFLGAECSPAQPQPTEDGAEPKPPLQPLRRVGILPFDAKRPWRPSGAVTPWELKIPRAEFAAGGTFRFRGSISYGQPLQNDQGTDVFGSGIISGKIAIDLAVRRLGR